MSADHHDHGHANPEAAKDPRYRRILWAALVINAAMFAVELGAGFRSNSVSLLADAIDFLGDAANYGVSLVVLSMAPIWRAKAALLNFTILSPAYSAGAGSDFLGFPICCGRLSL